MRSPGTTNRCAERPSGPTRRGDTRGRLQPPLPGAPLAVLAGVVTVLSAAGVLPRWPGLVHLVALPPLDVMADLRVLLVHAPSYPLFLAGVALSLTVRTLVLGWLLGGRFRFAVRYYLAVVPFAFVAAGLTYTSSAVLFYALFWVGTAAALAVVAVFAAAPFTAAPGVVAALGRALRRGFRLGTLGAYLLVLFLLGAVVDVGGDRWSPLFVPASAALTWVAAGFLRADPGFRIWRRAAAALLAAGLGGLAAVALTGPTGPGLAAPPVEPRPGSLMLMSGVDSRSGDGAMLEIDTHSLGFTCEQTFYFSYAGPGDGQPRRKALCPITTGAPYVPEDTLRPTEELIRFLEQQLDGLAPPVTLATHSQGVWVTWQAAAAGRLPGVEHLVLAGPFPENPVPFPAPGERGPGRLGVDLIRLVTDFPRPGGTSVFQPDSPLAREWLGHPDAISETLARPLPEGMGALGVPSVSDLPLMPDGWRLAGARDACPVPVIHPNLPYAAEFRAAVNRFLDGERLRGPCPGWRLAVGPLFRPFAAPPRTSEERGLGELR